MNIRIPEQNYVLIAGRLTRDPELRFTQKGLAVCSFDVAVTRSYRDKATGELKEDTAYVPVIVWGPTGEKCRELVKKGSAVHVEGRLANSDYVDKSGQKRRMMRVVARNVQCLSVAAPGETSGGPERAETETVADKAADVSGMDEVPF